jgi:hypothetical protein
MSRIENRLRHMDLIVCHEAADEIERLRELLKECQEYVEAGMSSVDSELCDRIEREVSMNRKDEEKNEITKEPGPPQSRASVQNAIYEAAYRLAVEDLRLKGERILSIRKGVER